MFTRHRENLRKLLKFDGFSFFMRNSMVVRLVFGKNGFFSMIKNEK
jgi:hypothetical protein